MNVPSSFPLQFDFRNSPRSCLAFVDQTEQPTLVFVILRDTELIGQYGEELTIKTDLKNTLPKKDDFPGLDELKQSIWFALKQAPQFTPRLVATKE